MGADASAPGRPVALQLATNTLVLFISLFFGVGGWGGRGVAQTRGAEEESVFVTCPAYSRVAEHGP